MLLLFIATENGWSTREKSAVPIAMKLDAEIILMIILGAILCCKFI
jgi:hypothetical protein